MFFQSKLTIFYQASPRFGSKWDSFVGILVPNTCVYGCRLVIHQFKFNICSLSRFIKLRMGIIDRFLLQPHPFLSKKSPFRRKIDSFCGYPGPKHMCVWLQTRIILFQSQYWLIRKVHEASDGNHGQFSSPTSPFSTKPVLILVVNGLVLWLLWPKIHVYSYYTSLNSILVHYQGSWSLGWES